MYGIGAQILRDLGVRKMKLLASPRRMPSMAGFDLEVTGYIASPADLDLIPDPFCCLTIYWKVT
jgi:3,4-dihydroxy 2-butanone 4-phosphate synthase/GTP cyclohydrolase II